MKRLKMIFLIILIFSFYVMSVYSTQEPSVTDTSIKEDTQTDENITSDTEKPEEILSDFDWTADLSKESDDSLNVQNYIVDKTETEMMYGAESVLRRDNTPGEAWIIYKIPYLTEFYAVSYHLASDVAHFSFELSKDGIEWITADVSSEETTDPEKWTKVEYWLNNIQNVGYIKVLWGTEENTENWWNPYFGGISANTGEAVATKIVIHTNDELSIPMYDSKKILLEGQIYDQIDIKIDSPITWSLIYCEDERVEISPENEIEIYADMGDGLEICVKAESSVYDLSCEKTFVLRAAMPGDIDGNNIITQDDISFIIENYGKIANDNNRLCDVDKNGMIDIIDLAYAARYEHTEELKTES